MAIADADLKKINANKLYQTLGIRLVTASKGRARSRLHPRSEVCWPFPGQPHGGILFTLVDTTMAWAVFSELPQGSNCTTIHLNIQYPAPARGDIFDCTTRIQHRTGRLCFVNGKIEGPDRELVATGEAVFRIIQAPPIF
jgi:uncharacterized protein (TIGR00369 family)